MSTTNEVATPSITTNASQLQKDTQPATDSKPYVIGYRKEIAYDRETRDYAMYLDGELVGFGRTYHEAEVTLDQLVYELMTGEYFRGAA